MHTLIWAHRGASGNAPENTLAAFALADKVGADGIELDVHFTLDRQVIVVHDDDVQRVTYHQGPVSSMTLAQLKKLDFSNKMAAFCGEQIPTLEEVLQLVAPGKMHINCELKTNSENPNGLEEATQALVEKYNMQDRFMYSSFNHYSLLRMKEVAPQMACGALYSNKVAKPWDYAKMMGFDAVHPMFASINQPDYMANCHAAGIKCNTWTVNTEQDIRAMLEAGVDGIITNYPALALTLRAEYEAK